MPTTPSLAAGLRWVLLGTVFLISAECAARLEDSLAWGVPLLGPYSEARLTMQDSLGIRGRPGYRYEKWRMNTAGFRGPDLSPAPAPGTTRIAVLGASETFGLFESEGREYPARMGAILDSLAPGRFEVINVALAGMGLAAMTPYYQHQVAPIHPAVVFIYPSPSFYLSEIAPALIYSAPSHAWPTTAGGRPAPTAPAGQFELRLAGKAREVLKGLVPPLVVTAYRERGLRRQRAAHDADWVWQSVPQARMEILEQHLDRLIEAIQASGAEVVLVTHTNRFIGAPAAVQKKYRRHLINLISEHYPQASEHVMVAVDSAANEIVRGLARKHGTALVEAETKIPPEYFGDYAHFTDPGADAMARLLASAVLRLQRGADKP